MEFLNIVNGQDEIIGQANREEIYRQLLPHRIVHVWLVDQNKRLVLHKRGAKLSFCPLHWCSSAAGHVLAGESYKAAAQRELQEELGVQARLAHLDKDLYLDPRGLKKFITTYTASHSGPWKPSQREVAEIKFFTLEEIRLAIEAGEKFHPELLFLLQRHWLDASDKARAH